MEVVRGMLKLIFEIFFLGNKPHLQKCTVTSLSLFNTIAMSFFYH